MDRVRSGVALAETLPFVTSASRHPHDRPGGRVQDEKREGGEAEHDRGAAGRQSEEDDRSTEKDERLPEPFHEQLDARPALKEAESMQEQVPNKRQMASTAFQNFDQKANQLYNLLSSVMKALNEMRMGSFRNML